MRFVDGHGLWLSVHGGGGREHQPLHGGALHGVQQVERAGDVVAEVQAGLPHGFAHQRARGEVQHRADGPGLEGAVETVRLQQVAFGQGAVLHRPAMSGGEVVEGDRHAAGTRQRLAHVRAGVAGAAEDEDVGCFGLHGVDCAPLERVCGGAVCARWKPRWNGTTVRRRRCAPGRGLRASQASRGHVPTIALSLASQYLLQHTAVGPRTK